MAIYTTKLTALLIHPAVAVQGFEPMTFDGFSLTLETPSLNIIEMSPLKNLQHVNN